MNTVTVKCIKTLQRAAGMADPEYRALLQRCGGVSSCKDLDEPSARMVCAVLRGMIGDRKKKARAAENRTPGENKIWGLWYQLQPYLPECDRCSAYFLGIIDKVTGREFIPGLVDGPVIRLEHLGPRWTWKVIEALKKRLQYEQDRQGETADDVTEE